VSNVLAKVQVLSRLKKLPSVLSHSGILSGGQFSAEREERQEEDAPHILAQEMP